MVSKQLRLQLSNPLDHSLLTGTSKGDTSCEVSLLHVFHGWGDMQMAGPQELHNVLGAFTFPEGEKDLWLWSLFSSHTFMPRLGGQHFPGPCLSNFATPEFVSAPSVQNEETS